MLGSPRRFSQTAASLATKGAGRSWGRAARARTRSGDGEGWKLIDRRPTSAVIEKPLKNQRNLYIAHFTRRASSIRIGNRFVGILWVGKMQRLIGKLKALTVARLKQAGMYSDGGGLYLQVTNSGARSWIFRYWTQDRDPATSAPIRDNTGMVRGRSREMGLGSVAVVSLEEARELAGEYRKLRRQGVDPIEARRNAKTQAALNAAKAITFAKCAEDYIQSHRAGWRNAKHAQQWENTLATYAQPIIGALPVQAIDTTLVYNVLKPIWTTKPEMGSRVRGRIENILDWAKVRGYRAGENPARWRGHLDHLLPARSKVKKTKHHAALPYAETPAFVAELQKRGGTAARALEFAILTAARSGEVLRAQWCEFNLNDAVWTVPGARMKAGRDHRVPLTPRALKIVSDMAGLSDEFVFPNGESGRPLAEKALFKTLRRTKVENATVHGFRSAFRDWAAERTNFANEVCEAALAHTIENKTEAAYRRTDLFEKRRKLMQAWAKFCNEPTSSADVIPLQRSA
jgi:integrase